MQPPIWLLQHHLKVFYISPTFCLALLQVDAFGWEVCVCPGCSLGQCNVVGSSTAIHPQLDVVPTLLARLQLQLTSACGGATGSIWCFTNRKVILRSCQHLSTSITRTHANTHRSATRPYPHTHESTDTLRSATHKAVNNRKWYVAEIVSVQLDSASTALFFPQLLYFLCPCWSVCYLPGLPRGFYSI